MRRRSGKVRLPGTVRGAAGEKGEATGKVIGDRDQKEAEGTARRAEDEFTERMRGTQDRPCRKSRPISQDERITSRAPARAVGSRHADGTAPQ